MDITPYGVRIQGERKNHSDEGNFFHVVYDPNHPLYLPYSNSESFS